VEAAQAEEGGEGKMLLAIDPGPVESAYVVLDRDLRPIDFDKLPNADILSVVNAISTNNSTYSRGLWRLAIEMIASYGMSVGREVFETCVWIGRFTQAAEPLQANYIYRKDVKMNLCGSPRAKDSNIIRALVDRFAKHDMKMGKGTKKNPDWFHGFSRDIWQAYAVGITYYDLHLKNL